MSDEPDRPLPRNPALAWAEIYERSTGSRLTAEEREDVERMAEVLEEPVDVEEENPRRARFTPGLRYRP